MFQSFTGSSRRPRQVNLSGRNSNPFAAAAGPTTQTSQNAVVHAQQERLVRQQERERLLATKTLQRTWRGHKSRHELKTHYRKEWDFREADNKPEPGEDTATTAKVEPSPGPYGSEQEALAQLRLLLQFATPLDEHDIKRVERFSIRFRNSRSSWSVADIEPSWVYPLVRLVKICASMLTRNVASPSLPEPVMRELLRCLSTSAMLAPEQVALHSNLYYHTIAELIRHSPGYCPASASDQLLFEEAILALLKPFAADAATAYDGFISEILIVGDLQDRLGGLDGVARVLDRKLMTASLKSLLTSGSSRSILTSKSNEELLWILAYSIYFYRSMHNLNNTAGDAPEADYIFVVSNLLSYLADELSSRIDIAGGSSSNPLPVFVHNQISTLVTQNSVATLLAQSELPSTSVVGKHESSSETAALANYALTLLRVFPRKGDEIRMWLYLGSTLKRAATNDHAGNRVPAIKYFWEALVNTHVFSSIREHPRNAIDLLRTETKKEQAYKRSLPDGQNAKNQEWRVILLFLELYTFVLKVMDDEEFMSGNSIYDQRQSWTRQSALELGQVKDLTHFLRNLAFSMYWNSADILGSEESVTMTSLADYFNTTSTPSWTDHTSEPSTRTLDVTVAGVSGMSLTYMKGMVTGLLRMIYERDSRRHFLPKDHWLMTKYFDMEGFIPAVVAEEDYRHQMQEAEDADGEAIEPEPEGDDLDREILIGTNRTQQVRRIERLKRQQRKVARRKHLEAVTPRLEILQNMPFFIPFATRVAIFREFVTADQMRRRHGFVDADQWRFSVMHNSSGIGPDGRRVGYDNLSKHHAKVRRDSVFEDAYAQFYELGDGLKEPIQITFVDKFDTVEAGIDGGGVTKEFLTSVTSEAFTPTSGLNLFVENDQHLLYPNPAAVDERKDLLRQVGFREGSPDWNEPIRDLLRRYEFLGRVIGKCLYEGILVDIHFAPFFLLKWALTGGSGSATNESSYRANINDLRDLDEGLYQGLLQLKNYPGNVEDFSLDFTVTDTISTPVYDQGPGAQPSQRTITRDLRPNGSQIPVTNENRLVYISYMARHRLQIQPHQQTSAFLRGLAAMVQPSWLSMFNQSELQTLLGGDSSEIDVPDLRRNTLYGGVYVIGHDNQEHPSVRMFWDVMQSFSDADRRKVLKYVTSTPRAPLLGFGQLNPHFSIRDSGSDQTRLPSTSTCVNLLKLPIYSNTETLREKLLYAINAGAGFNLS